MGEYSSALNNFLKDYDSQSRNETLRAKVRKDTRRFLKVHFFECYQFARKELSKVLLQMFSSFEVFDIYEKSGSKLNPLTFESLFSDSPQFIEDNLLAFTKHDCRLDELLQDIKKPISSLEDVKKYLNFGIDPEQVYNACKNQRMAYALIHGENGIIDEFVSLFLLCDYEITAGQVLFDLSPFCS